MGLTDGDIYGMGLTEYETKLETIRRGMDSTPKQVKPAVPEEELKAIRQHATDEKDRPFRTPYQLELARIRGEKVPQFGEFGFKKYPSVIPKEPEHALDTIYESAYYPGGEPPKEMLKFYTLTRENWFILLPETQVILHSLWNEKRMI